jgi:hypothetical protein
MVLGASDFQPAVDTVIRAARSLWWNWDDGSRPFHWRWLQWFRKIIRDRLPVFFRSQKPSYRKAQRGAPDSAAHDKIKEKLDAVRKRRYITPGFVKSLTAFFSVPKGEEDVRIVCDGTVSGLNDSIWVPRFLLPTIETHLRAVDEETFMADADVGECFLNFILHPERESLPE